MAGSDQEQKRAGDNTNPYHLLRGRCPDDKCKTLLFFPAHEASVECTECGQRHQQRALVDVEEVTNRCVAVHNVLRNALLVGARARRRDDAVRVLGLSNDYCKLLSPLLTEYGMDRTTKRARPLREMAPPSAAGGSGAAETFDCSKLGDRAFLLNPEHLDVRGYGRDVSGSQRYLQATLDVVRKFNRGDDDAGKDGGAPDGGEENLVPVYASGDGHCLVHAVSRALVGRELFWHALRMSLKRHFTEKLGIYREQFRDFISGAEWSDIIAECDPFFQPPDGEPLGLRTAHIFGLANVLHRPIILLDSLEGMQSLGEHSGVFLPGLLEPEECRTRGVMNKPICIAWSSSARNHFISLVGVKGRSLPRLPRWVISKTWGMPSSSIDSYVEFDSDQCCTIGGDRSLSVSAFGSEVLVQKVANQLLAYTANPEPRSRDDEGHEGRPSPYVDNVPSKIIMKGHKTFHKEELGVSETERTIRARIERRAVETQSRASGGGHAATPTASTKKRTDPAAAAPAHTAHQLPTQVPKKEEVGKSNVGQASKPRTVKKIRVSTMDSRQVTLNLTLTTTFAQLQQQIADALGIPRERQLIRCGYPLKELRVEEGRENEPVALEHGEKLSVTMRPDPSKDMAAVAMAQGPQVEAAVERQKAVWSNFKADIHDQSDDEFLKGLDQQKESELSAAAAAAAAAPPPAASNTPSSSLDEIAAALKTSAHNVQHDPSVFTVPFNHPGSSHHHHAAAVAPVAFSGQGHSLQELNATMKLKSQFDLEDTGA
ncbi:PREDICTED: deubiquitinating protein VCIP135-like [Priapulus caudatus]|uniref:ubiquitinyl hydrolase 1 n=1 Tax=Priapulus caudatus TaxID=37621 RepID=A0ABM1EZ27_PRICU|nr:PREDICTED: deubiquitinating protein VCIP135-like [Priapulus caudatus]